MSTEATQEATTQEQTQTAPSLQDRLTASILGEPLSVQETTQQQNQTQEQSQQQSTAEEFETVDASVYLKKWGFDSEEAAEKEINELREFKTKGNDIQFANDDSKRLFEYLKEGKEDEAYEIISRKKQIERLIGGEVTDATAAEIVKLSLKNKYKEFDDADISRKFNKQYQLPKEPVQDTINESDDEFADKKKEWEEKVSEIKADLIMDAKIAKTELAQLKAELVLPDIQKNNGEQKPTQEDLKAFEELKKSFVQTTEPLVNSFNGFTVPVKDKDVDYSVSYVPSQDEKGKINEAFKIFAEKDFDANVIVGSLWANPDGKTINTQRMMEDLSFLFNRDNITKTIALKAANERMELFLKDKRQVNINETTTQGQFKPEAKELNEKLADAILAL